jgi:hypothetical protein
MVTGGQPLSFCASVLAPTLSKSLNYLFSLTRILSNDYKPAPGDSFYFLHRRVEGHNVRRGPVQEILQIILNMIVCDIAVTVYGNRSIFSNCPCPDHITKEAPGVARQYDWTGEPLYRRCDGGTLGFVPV